MSLFTLNATSLLFLPIDNPQKCLFTSIYVHTTHTDDDVLALYAQVQQTTSTLVTKLAAQHARLPLPRAAFPLVLEGDGYNLHCSEPGICQHDASIDSMPGAAQRSSHGHMERR